MLELVGKKELLKLTYASELNTIIMSYTADVVAHIIIIVHTVLKKTSARILGVRISGTFI